MKASSTNSVAVVQLAIGTLIVAIVLRTWLVMGLIEPVTVAGNSMVPTLLGPHVSVQCERCSYRFDVGAEFAAETVQAECPQCGFQENSLAELPVIRGDRLIIDRTVFSFRLPERWEPVVFLSPADKVGLVVKRVVGLPGETIQLRDGEVWIDGQLAKKPLTTLHHLRSLVHLESSAAQRWSGDGWSWTDQAWNCKSESTWRWLSYKHTENEPVTDDMAYNAGLTRRLFAVRDLSLSTRLQFVGTGELAILYSDGEQEWEIRLKPTTSKLELLSEEKLLSRAELSTKSTQQLQSGEVQIELSSCDQQLLVAIGGELEMIHKTGPALDNNDSRPHFSVGARNLAVSLNELRIYRDCYFASREQLLSLSEPMAPFTLSEEEVYVLGDNVPISLDSRDWGPLPLRFLVGKPLGVH